MKHKRVIARYYTKHSLQPRGVVITELLETASGYRFNRTHMVGDPAHMELWRRFFVRKVKEAHNKLVGSRLNKCDVFSEHELML